MSMDLREMSRKKGGFPRKDPEFDPGLKKAVPDSWPQLSPCSDLLTILSAATKCSFLAVSVGFQKEILLPPSSKPPALSMVRWGPRLRQRNGEI